MPFWLKNAPSAFQRAILNTLGDLAYSYVIVYLVDVLIIADSIYQALERLYIVFQVFVDEGAHKQLYSKRVTITIILLTFNNITVNRITINN